MTTGATCPQSSYVCGASTSTLIGLSIGQVLDDTADRFPERDALIVKHENRRFTRVFR